MVVTNGDSLPQRSLPVREILYQRYIGLCSRDYTRDSHWATETPPFLFLFLQSYKAQEEATAKIYTSVELIERDDNW